MKRKINVPTAKLGKKTSVLIIFILLGVAQIFVVLDSLGVTENGVKHFVQMLEGFYVLLLPLFFGVSITGIIGKIKGLKK